MFPRLNNSHQLESCTNRSNVALHMSVWGPITHVVMVSHGLQAALATLFSGCIGCLTALLQMYSMRSSWNYNDVASAWARAVRVSVVTAAASCTVVPLWSHLLTAPLAVIFARKVHNFFIRTSVSDPSGVVAVHLVGGVCSMVSVGIFAKPVRYTDLCSDRP